MSFDTTDIAKGDRTNINPTPPLKLSKESSKVLVITTGESEFIREDDQEKFIYTDDTTTCLQICLFGTDQNNKKEMCLIHWNQSFELDWQQILGQFQSTHINMKVIGAALSGTIASLNIETFQKQIKQLNSLSHKESKDSSCKTVALVGQCVLGQNSDFVGARDLIWDINGVCYDAATLKSGLNLTFDGEKRIAREKEGELREWFGRKFQKTLAKPKVLLKADRNSQSFEPSYFSVAIIQYILTEKRLKNYLEAGALAIHFSLTSAQAKSHMNDTMMFVKQCQGHLKTLEIETLAPLCEAKEAAFTLAPKQFKLMTNFFRPQFMASQEKMEKSLTINVCDEKQTVLFAFTINSSFASDLNMFAFLLGQDDKDIFSRKNEMQIDFKYQYICQLIKHYKGITIAEQSPAAFVMCAKHARDIFLERLKEYSLAVVEYKKEHLALTQ